MPAKKEELLAQLASLSLSEFKNNFPVRINERIKAMEMEQLRIAAQHFPSKNVSGLGDFGGAVARCYSQASDERGSVIFGIFTFGVLVDDMLDGCEATHNEKLNQLFLKLVRNEPICMESYSAYAKIIKFSQPIFQQFQSMTSQHAFHRLGYHFQNYFEAVKWEVQHRKLMPDSETLKYMRRFNAGTEISLDLVEFASEIELPLVVREHPVIKNLNLLATETLVYDNDIGSLKKEVREGTVNNLALAFFVNENLPTLQSALDKLIHQRVLHESEILELVINLPDFGENNEVTNKYIDGIFGLLGGNYGWVTTSSRYTN